MIIDYLHNFSDKKWTEIKQTESKRISTPNSQSNDVNGNDSIPKAVSTGTGVGTNTNTESSALPIMPTVRSQTSLAGAQTITTSAASNAHKPMIRVKAIESMKEANRPNAVNTTKLTNISTNGNGNAPKIVNSVKVVNSPVVQISTATVQKPNKETSDQSTPIVTEKSDTNQPVKLWNNVMQRKVDKPLDYLVVSNKEDANRDNAVFCIKPTEELIENAKENGSVLKIDQVYECVSDEFVEDLLVERTPRPSSASNTSPSPLLDTLVNEVQNIITSPKPTNNQTEKTSERKLTFASPSDEDCSDYRCNVCLRFNQTFAEYKIHMMKSHFYSYVCEKCRDVFKNRNLYYDHLDSKMKCVRRENSSRAFVCIVDPPVILMRNSKVFAFRCRHCNVAFHNQRNYVQHAQRHAKLFRCKICPSAKTMSAPFMQRHLGQHKP